MRRYSLDHRRVVAMPKSRECRLVLAKQPTIERQLEKEGIEPTSEIIAKMLDVSELSVQQVRSAVRMSDMVIDQPDSDGRTDRRDLVTHDHLAGPAPEEPFEHEGLVRDALKVLTDKQRLVLQMRVMDENEAILKEVAEVLGCSRERVRQIQNEALHKLRQVLSRQGVSHA
jgi:RNA polymerase nonessential primary-like sigma factor